MTKKALLGVAAAILAVAAVAWYFASPGYAMMQLKDAAESGDEAALEERIDFPRLREELKSDLKRQMAASVASEENDGFAALGAALALAMVDPLIDGFITPEAMSEMVKAGKLRQLGEDEVKASTNEAEVDWTITREGLSRFRATPDVPEGEQAPALVFERDGLGWKLVELDIPERALNIPN